MTSTELVRFRPLVSMYRAVATIASTPALLDMSEAEFTASCMRMCDGRVDPKQFRRIYYDLMKEAGVSFRSEVVGDNGDHSWEYYVEGELVKEDAYLTAHTSYYKA